MTVENTLMRWMARAYLWIVLTVASCEPAAGQVDYPIVLLQGPHGRTRNATIAELGQYDMPICALIERLPDGSTRVLDAAGAMDPVVSFDGIRIAYGRMAGQGVDLREVNADTLQFKTLVNWQQIWNPPRSTFKYSPTPLPPDSATAEFWNEQGMLWFDRGVWITAPAYTPTGIVFATNASYYTTPEASGSAPIFELWRCDHDGRNIERVGFHTINSSDHPHILTSGKVMWWQQEDVGIRAGMSGIWQMNPDGTNSSDPIVSALGSEQTGGFFALPPHFETQLSDGSIAFIHYYQTRNEGRLLQIPVWSPGMGGGTRYSKPNPLDNPGVRNGYTPGAVIANGQITQGDAIYSKWGFQPRGLKSLTPAMTAEDAPPATIDGQPAGTVTHPAGAPGNKVLVTWNKAGEAGSSTHGIYLIDPAQVQDHTVAYLQQVIDTPQAEYMAKPRVPYSQIYGIDTPPNIEQQEPAEHLRPGEPYGIVGSGSMLLREAEVFQGLQYQGGDIDPGVTTNPNSIEYIAIYHANPTPLNPRQDFLEQAWSKLGSGKRHLSGWHNGIGMLTPLYVDGVIPLRKWRLADGSIQEGGTQPAGATAILDPAGMPDTSFLVKLPADQPFWIALLDAAKRIVSVSQTLHQVRPGEHLTQCNQCHTHWNPQPWNVYDAFAGTEEYTIRKLRTVKPVTEFYADVRPILLALGMSTEFNEIALSEGDWQRGFESDQVKPLRSRHSQLYYSARDQFGATPGQLEVLANWIDTGATRDTYWQGQPTGLPQADTLPPTVHVYSPRRRENLGPIDKFVIGMADPDSGLGEWSVTLDAEVVVAGNAHPPGSDLSALFIEDDEVWTLTLDEPITQEDGWHTLSVRARDTYLGRFGEVTGNLTKIDRYFAAGSGEPPPPIEPPTCEELLAQCEAEQQVLQQQIADLQAQSTADAATIAMLQAQVAQLETEKAALKAQIAAALVEAQQTVEALQ